MKGALVGVIEQLRSLTWTRRYSQAGSFDATMPLTPENLRLTELNRLAWIRGAPNACLIESRVITDSADQQDIVISGRDVLCYLDRRLLNWDFEADDPIRASAVLSLLFRGEASGGRYTVPIDGVSYVDDKSVTYKLPEGYTKSAGTSLLEIAEDLAALADAGLKSTCDLSGGTANVKIRMYMGVNRGAGQSARQPVIFSKRWNNLERVGLTQNIAAVVNTVVVRGYWAAFHQYADGSTWTEGGKYYRVTVYLNDKKPADSERREAQIDCSFDATGADMTLERYKVKMRQEGRAYLKNALKGTVAADAVDCEVLGDVQFRYRRDWDVGDIVSVQSPELGVDVDKRITEVQEVYEQEGRRLAVTFGNSLPTRIRMRRR